MTVVTMSITLSASIRPVRVFGGGIRFNTYATQFLHAIAADNFLFA